MDPCASCSTAVGLKRIRSDIPTVEVLYREVQSMPSLVHFKDTQTMCFALFLFPEKKHIYLGVARTGVIVKQSRFGLFGRKLFSGDVLHTGHACVYLKSVERQDKAHEEMKMPVLRVFSSSILSSDTISDVADQMDKAMKFALRAIEIDRNWDKLPK